MTEAELWSSWQGTLGSWDGLLMEVLMSALAVGAGLRLVAVALERRV